MTDFCSPPAVWFESCGDVPNLGGWPPCTLSSTGGGGSGECCPTPVVIDSCVIVNGAVDPNAFATFLDGTLTWWTVNAAGQSIPVTGSVAIAAECGPGAANIIEALGATYWLSTVDFDDDTIQALPPRIGADPSTRGSDPVAVDSADPTINLTGTPRLTFAGDDFVVFPPEAIPSFTHTTGQFTLVAVAATTNTGTRILWQTNPSADLGFSLFVRNGTDEIVARVGSVTRDSVATVDFNDGSIRGIGMVISDGSFRVYERSIGFGTVQTALAPTHTFARLGGAGALGWIGSVYHLAVFPTALTEPELETVIDYLIGLT